MDVKNKRLNLILLFGLFCWIASSCTTAAPPPTAAVPTEVVSAPVLQPTITEPSTPTARALPSMTPLPTDTPTPEPTATQVPPPDDFSEAKLFSVFKTGNWNFGLTISLPDPIKGEYYALVGDPGKPYSCHPLIEYNHPERLYCSGRVPAVEKYVDIKIFEKANDQLVFTSRTYIPFQKWVKMLPRFEIIL